LPTIEDYHIISTSGEGAYGKVLSARCKMTNHLVAIKKIEMKLLIDVNKVGSAHREK
jgi:serine/threonine protein kinase